MALFRHYCINSFNFFTASDVADGYKCPYVRSGVSTSSWPSLSLTIKNKQGGVGVPEIVQAEGLDTGRFAALLHLLAEVCTYK